MERKVQQESWKKIVVGEMADCFLLGKKLDKVIQVNLIFVNT